MTRYTGKHASPLTVNLVMLSALLPYSSPFGQLLIPATVAEVQPYGALLALVVLVYHFVKYKNVGLYLSNPMARVLMIVLAMCSLLMALKASAEYAFTPFIPQHIVSHMWEDMLLTVARFMLGPIMLVFLIPHMHLIWVGTLRLYAGLLLFALICYVAFNVLHIASSQIPYLLDRYFFDLLVSSAKNRAGLIDFSGSQATRFAGLTAEASHNTGPLLLMVALAILLRIRGVISAKESLGWGAVAVASALLTSSLMAMIAVLVFALATLWARISAIRWASLTFGLCMIWLLVAIYLLSTSQKSLVSDVLEPFIETTDIAAQAQQELGVVAGGLGQRLKKIEARQERDIHIGLLQALDIESATRVTSLYIDYTLPFKKYAVGQPFSLPDRWKLEYAYQLDAEHGCAICALGDISPRYNVIQYIERGVTYGRIWEEKSYFASLVRYTGYFGVLALIILIYAVLVRTGVLRHARQAPAVAGVAFASLFISLTLSYPAFVSHWVALAIIPSILPGGQQDAPTPEAVR